MSLKDLFRKQNVNNTVVTSENATASAEYVESVATIKAKEKLNDQFVPRLDYSTASNFAKFGSAELYYEYGFKRIYNEYPYDGTEEEKINFRLSSSYLDDYIFENHYPRTNGYVQFSAVNTTISTTTDGYGEPTTPEYILTKGGPHTASSGMVGNSIASKFGESNYYDSANDLGSSLEVNFDQGVSVEFWLKKSAWDDTDNHKEVIFDLWNYENSSSADYGRLTIGLTASANGANPFCLTLQSGTTGFFERTPTVSGITTSSVGDNSWHHYAFTFTSQSAGIETKIYIDGVKEATDTYGSSGIGNITTISGNLSTIGGLITAPSGTAVATTGSGKLNAYMDEFRYWKKSRSDKQIANNFFIPLAGGNNNYEYNRKLGVYYKFNEGITGTDAIDTTVLDYSGRIANGVWTGYTSSARSTNSAMVESGYARSEFKDPIIYSSHPDVISTLATLTTTGSEQDYYGTSKMMSLLPGWLQEKDRDNYQDQVKKFVQILASYFDNLHAQIGEMNKIFDEDYPTPTEEPYPFAQNLLESRGFVVPDLFVDGDLVNYLLQKDNNEIFEQNITDVKNRIYHNIYNNLTYILKSKGTEKSFRNLLRCFGIDTDVMRLSLYADDSTYVIQENYEDTSVEKKVLNLNNRYNLEGTIYNISSSDSNFTYISSSEGSQEEYTAMTVQCEAIFPLHPEKFDEGYFPKLFTTSSIFGFHRALTSSAADYTWNSDDTDIQVYAIRNEAESKDAYFKLTSSLGFEITSSTYFNLFENNKWNFAVRVRNNKYPYTYGLSGSTTDDYFVEFVGYNSEGNTTKNSFSLSSSVSNAIGKQLLCNSKRLYAGAYKTNFTGSTIARSDVKISDVKFWQTYLDDETIKYHSYSPNNFGTKTPFRPDNVNTSIENLEITDLETLALHWRFDTLTTSDSSGEFEGFDFASGSAENASRNSWLGGITGHKYPFKGQNFITSSTKAFDRDFIYAAKQRKFGVLMSSDGVTIKDDANTLLFTDDDVSDNFYAFEKSYYGVISEEMVNFFASLVEFNDLVGQPIDGYKRSYKEMEKLARLFFEKVESRIEPERFFDFYKWIDSSITYALTQLFPASAKYSETTRNIIESHLLERNKYDRKFPLLIDVTATEGFARGVNELFYNWKFGHAPVPSAENKNCLWQKHRKERTDITDRQTILDNLNNGNNVKHLGKLQQDGTAYVGSTYALRNFSKLSKFSVVMDKNYHGGTNYSDNKNRDIVWDATYIHGPTTQNYPKGIPQNILAVGLGEGQGTEAFIDCVDEEIPNQKRKWRFTTVAGRRTDTPSANEFVPRTSEQDYKAIVKGEIAWPTNLISASVTTGYQSEVVSKFKQGVVITNIHSDTYAPGNEIGMQGPFTETWVGGHQSRHVNLNAYDSSKTTINKLDDQYSREEGWRLLLKECDDAGIVYRDSDSTEYGSQTGANDGAMGFVGPDYGGPYPDYTRKYAVRYREERAKRPVNVKNIQTTTSSVRVGNFKKNYEVVMIAGKEGNNLMTREYDLENRTKDLILPDPIWNQRPDCTNYQTLVGFLAGYYGNVWGDARCFDPDFDTKKLSNIGDQIFQENNRQVQEDPGRAANGSFYISGALVEGVKASGSFRVYSTQNYMYDEENGGVPISDGKYFTILSKNFNIDTASPPTADVDPNYYIETGSNRTDFYNNIDSKITTALGYNTSYTTYDPQSQAFSFSGSNNNSRNYFTLNDDTSFDQTNETISLWIDLSGSNYDDPVNDYDKKYLYYHTSGSGDVSKEIFISGGVLYYNKYFDYAPARIAKYSIANFETTYKNQKFINLMIVNTYPSVAIAANQSVLYVNAVSQSVTYTATGIISNAQNDRIKSDGDLFIGGRTADSSSFLGKIASVAFYKSKLSDSPDKYISQHYNNGYMQRADKNTDLPPGNIIEHFIASENSSSIELGDNVATDTIWTGSLNNMHLTAAIGGPGTISLVASGAFEPPYAVFAVTGATNGTDYNSSINLNNGTPYDYFQNISPIQGGINNSGSYDGDTFRIQNDIDDVTFEVDYDSSLYDVSNIAIEPTGSSTDFWNYLTASIKSNTAYDTITVTPLVDPNGFDYAFIELTASTVGNAYNGTFTFTATNPSPESGGNRTSMFSLSDPGDGLNPVTYYNIIERVRDDLTASHSSITSKFSAPGGPEIQSRGYLDVKNQELSAYNALPWRNWLVRSSGSGEAGRIRVNDIHGNRFGLYTHLRRHSGQFGYDTAVGSETTEESFVTVPSFHKIQRNDMKRLNYSIGATVVTGTIYNNGFYQSCIPQSDFQYSWITASIGDDLTQRILGFAPFDGNISSSAGGVEDAIVFASASTIIGS